MIEMEMGVVEFKKMFSIPDSCQLGLYDVLTLGGNKYQIYEYELSYETPPACHLSGIGIMRKPVKPKIKISIVPFEEKSKEQQEAEEVVKKAEESLKAAKDVLSTIKGNN